MAICSLSRLSERWRPAPSVRRATSVPRSALERLYPRGRQSLQHHPWFRRLIATPSIVRAMRPAKGIASCPTDGSRPSSHRPFESSSPRSDWQRSARSRKSPPCVRPCVSFTARPAREHPRAERTTDSASEPPRHPPTGPSARSLRSNAPHWCSVQFYTLVCSSLTRASSESPVY